MLAYTSISFPNGSITFNLMPIGGGFRPAADANARDESPAPPVAGPSVHPITHIGGRAIVNPLSATVNPDAFGVPSTNRHSIAGYLRIPSKKFIGGMPMNPGNKSIGRPHYRSVRRVGLLNDAIFHDDDAIAERHRLFLIVRYIYGRGL